MSTGENKLTAKDSFDHSVRLVFTAARAKRFKAVRVKKLKMTQALLARDLGVNATTISRIETTSGLETWTPEITWGKLKKVLGIKLARYIQSGKGFPELELLIATWSGPTKVYDAGAIPSALKLKKLKLPDVFQGPEKEEEDENSGED
jgi:DNA-binding XRE family transcriptional regulator